MMLHAWAVAPNGSSAVAGACNLFNCCWSLTLHAASASGKAPEPSSFRHYSILRLGTGRGRARALA